MPVYLYVHLTAASVPPRTLYLLLGRLFVVANKIVALYFDVVR